MDRSPYPIAAGKRRRHLVSFDLQCPTITHVYRHRHAFPTYWLLSGPPSRKRSSFSLHQENSVRDGERQVNTDWSVRTISTYQSQYSPSSSAWLFTKYRAQRIPIRFKRQKFTTISLNFWIRNRWIVTYKVRLAWAFRQLNGTAL